MAERLKAGTKTRTSNGRGSRLSAFAARVRAGWERRGWPADGARVVVAVSGGADSAALLLAFDELLRSGSLRLEVTAAHLDHGLRDAEAPEDARWVAAQAAALDLPVVVGRRDVGALSAATGDNLEQAARRARYEFLDEVARDLGAWAVATAHTLDDQAETVLLRLVRGSGAEGLTGMRPERALAEGGEVRLVRPLLSWARRADTEGYCRERRVAFRTDAMNEDESFARVRVRRKVLPLLETFNPRVVEALARTAELLGDDASALDASAALLLEAARAEVTGDEEDAGGASPLRVDTLAEAPAALRRRALRRWIAAGRGGLRRVEMAHVLAVERLLTGERGGRVAELPGGGRVERRRGLLRFFMK